MKIGVVDLAKFNHSTEKAVELKLFVNELNEYK